MKRIIKICELLLFIFFVVLLIFTNDKLSTIISIPILLLIYYIVKKLNIKNYAMFIFVLALLIRIVSIIYLKVEIVDDFKTMLEASKMLIKGNISFINNFYFKYFSYQLGHVFYQALLLKIYSSVLFLKIVNSITTSLIVLFIYLISKKLFKEETARFISLVYLLYFYPLYLNSVLTNQHIPALLYLIIIYLLFNKKSSIKLYIIIGVLLSLSNFLRTESIVFTMGILIYNLISITKNNYKTIIKNISLMFIIYFALNTLISSVALISPINMKLKNNAPLWKFYCGLSYKHNGLYNAEDEQVFFNSNNQKELLKERIKEENIKIPVLFLKKEVILWTQTNYDLRIKNSISNILESIIFHINQGYLNIILILFVISLYPFKKTKNDKLLLIKIIIGLYICIYSIIEISPRYSYVLHMLIFICIGELIDRFFKNSKSLKKE